MTGGAADGGYRLQRSFRVSRRRRGGLSGTPKQRTACGSASVALRRVLSCVVSAAAFSGSQCPDAAHAPGPSGALAVSQGDLRSEGVHGAFCSHVVGSCGASTYAFRPTQYIRSVDRPKIATLDVVCRMPQLRASSARRESLAAVERREAESATSSMNLSTPCMRL